VPARPSPPPPRASRASPPQAKPSRDASDAPLIDRESPSVELRLSIGRDGLGIELGREVRLGCLDVTEIAVALAGVRFPLDVSGGVARFRHKRGELKKLAIEVDARALERWAAPKLRGIVSTETPEVWIAVRRDAASVGLMGRSGPRGSEAAEPAVLAFEVTLDTHEDDVRLTVAHARGMGLAAPPTALAIAVVRTLLKELATREGARFVVAHAAARIVRAILPEAGARAPSCPGVRWTMTSAAADAWILHATVGPQADVREEATRAREGAALAAEGDDARLAGDLVRARALDLAALERAPRHPAIIARVAEIDAIAGGRAEAALAMLREADPDPGAPRGPLAGELLAEAGDAGGAIAALARIGDTETVPALAARAYARAASLADDHHDALSWLDLALARAPSMAGIRWARVARRLAAGRIEDAVADVEHLEAIAVGARAKHAAWRRAGDAWRAAGLVGDAATLFERALRYAPDDPEALAGLGAALVEGACAPRAGRSARAERRAARGAALLARAIELGEARAADVSAMTIDLARALAEALGDRPAAIARVRAVPNVAREALLARGLEARWRAGLGDAAGASLAWGRVRDLAAARFEEGDPHDTDTAARLLREGAEFERDVRGDLAAAQRHLAAALRLRPRDAELDRAYRDVCARLAPAVAPTPALASTSTPSATALPPFASDSDPGDDAALAASRVEELIRFLQADPARDDVVDELAALLVRLGRSLELLALLSARLEDATPERRAQLLPPQRAVLARLEEEALAAGRASEASLFRDARRMLD
jgi:tetratricopeptide (TPR) repeat protein